MVCAVIIVLMPFHAFLTVWAASLLGHYTLLRLWKEILFALLCAGAVVQLVMSKEQRKWAGKDSLVLSVVAYLAVLLISGLVALGMHHVSLKAFAYGILVDSRFLIFFLITWLVSRRDDLLVRYWQRLVLLPAVAVVCFAALQLSILPDDFLRHFGYGPHTIPPTSTVDQQASYQRVQATLRGPNPLGAYLLVVLASLGTLLLKSRERWKPLAVFFILALVALFGTFSRSAWIGMIIGTAWLIWVSISSTKVRQGLLIAGAAAVLMFGAVTLALRHNDRFENVFFHTSEHSRSSLSSNAGHSQALKNGLLDIVHQPLGRGTGTAGPASEYNVSPARIAENYYIQIGQEAGVLALGLFVAINVLVVMRLWRRRQEMLALALLASFIGIVIINMLMHAWTDDTLAYVWWGMAGAAMALPAGLTGRHEKKSA